MKATYLIRRITEDGDLRLEQEILEKAEAQAAEFAASDPGSKWAVWKLLSVVSFEKAIAVDERGVK